MSLITLAYAKEKFQLWNKYFLDPTTQVASDTILQSELDDSEAELGEYVTVTTATITNAIKRHLMNILKYRGWVRVHGDTEFEEKTQIVKDYEATIKTLEEFRNYKKSLTGITPANAGAVSITEKTQVFSSWFNEEEEVS